VRPLRVVAEPERREEAEAPEQLVADRQIEQIALLLAEPQPDVEQELDDLEVEVHRDPRPHADAAGAQEGVVVAGRQDDVDGQPEPEHPVQELGARRDAQVAEPGVRQPDAARVGGVLRQALPVHPERHGQIDSDVQEVEQPEAEQEVPRELVRDEVVDGLAVRAADQPQRVVRIVDDEPGAPLQVRQDARAVHGEAAQRVRVGAELLHVDGGRLRRRRTRREPARHEPRQAQRSDDSRTSPDRA